MHSLKLRVFLRVDYTSYNKTNTLEHITDYKMETSDHRHWHVQSCFVTWGRIMREAHLL